MTKKTNHSGVSISLVKDKSISDTPPQFDTRYNGYVKNTLTIGKWNHFISDGLPKEIDDGVDLLEDAGSAACYFLDDMGSMRFKGLDGIIYYVFIDDDDIPYHIDPSQVYCYKPGEKVIPSKLSKEYRFYITSK